MCLMSSTRHGTTLADLRGELDILERILAAARQQHGRAAYFQYLRGAHKRMSKAHARVQASSAACSSEKQSAITAIERALHSIPPPYVRLRHLLAQTYFMPLALASLALLARSATLLTQLHANLSPIRNTASDATAVLPPTLLELAHSSQMSDDLLDRAFRHSQSSGATRGDEDVTCSALSSDYVNYQDSSISHTFPETKAYGSCRNQYNIDSLDDMGEPIGSPNKELGFMIDARPDDVFGLQETNLAKGTTSDSSFLAYDHKAQVIPDAYDGSRTTGDSSSTVGINTPSSRVNSASSYYRRNEQMSAPAPSRRIHSIILPNAMLGSKPRYHRRFAPGSLLHAHLDAWHRRQHCY